MKTWKSKRPISFLLILSLIAAIFISGKFIYTKTHRPKKNVILIIVDALRPDHLGCYGYERKTSPNIDNLAKKGVMFTQVIAQSTWTFPSMPSILTSTYPHTHGVNEVHDSLNHDLPTLADILKNNDYFTGLVVPVELKRLVETFEQGFDTLEFPEGNANEFTRHAIEWLKKNKSKPFFLWIHYYEVHGPYRPPAPYNKLFVADKFNFRNKEAPILSDGIHPIISKNSGIGGIPMYIAENNVTSIDYYISQYDGEIRFTDEHIGGLWKALEKLKLDKNTLIILTADHGESLGEHNLYFAHGRILYDDVLRVPLIIICDGIIPKNNIIEKQVQSIDIVPSILEILEIAKPKKMEGSSLLPLILGKDKELSPYAFSEEAVQGFDKISIRTNEWKLICGLPQHKNRWELYNLKDDPRELNNLIEIEKEKFIFLKEKLDNWKKQAVAIPKKPAQLTEEEKERLRSLGYLH